jgi:cobalt-zinc-cadmium efflux system membrane fusion protein
MKKRERSAYRTPAAVTVGIVVLVATAGVMLATAPELRGKESNAEKNAEKPIQSHSRGNVFYPTAAQWATISTVPAESRIFRQQLVTDGRIAIDEDRSTPVYSPYSGRITRLEVKPGEVVRPGQLLFSIDATDTIQGQNDFIAAVTSVAKAKSQFNLTQTIETRQKVLYAGKAVPLKDWQQAQADLATTTNDLRSAETTLDAASNRLRILGKTDAEIAGIQQSGKITADTPVLAPIAGTVVQRHAGPGQYVNAGAADPLFVIGDLSTVWLLANVREADVAKVSVGQPVSFKVPAYPDRTITGRLDYVASAVDPATRRLAAR